MENIVSCGKDHNDCDLWNTMTDFGYHDCPYNNQNIESLIEAKQVD